LRAGRVQEAAEQATVLEAMEEVDSLSGFVARSAREIAELEDPVSRAERIALLPVFSRGGANWHSAGYVPPKIREREVVSPRP
ncbi:MAG: hypothetical protein VCB99_03485, partial [Myxococcota bacterium]